MNIYDFDDTIYDGDTNNDIIKFFMKSFPFKVGRSLRKAKKLNKKYKKGKIPFEDVKSAMYSFLGDIPNVNDYINKFVLMNMNKIKPWYLKNKRDNDVIVTASYDLWIRPFCNKLGIKYVIATRCDENGKIMGKNCKGIEKVNRLKYHLPNIKFMNAYSDSASDIPMLEFAENGYVVEGNNIFKYEKGYKFKNSK